MQDVAIRLSGVDKRFRIYHEKHVQLKDVLMKRSRGTWDDLWALRDASLDIPIGQTLGIIGANGAGKSTTLKLLAGILYPDAGEIEVRGRVSSLLELGAGFQPEYTGRENVYLYGAILGLRTKEVRSHFDEIVAFSELERFIDYPVRNYSSGMYMRLGFSVAVHLNPDVLLIDEVLAVGDASFQRKCFQHLESLKQRRCTIVLVSHDMDAVGRFCDRVVWLDQGRIAMDGDPESTIRTYLGEGVRRAARRRDADGRERPAAAGPIEITGVHFRHDEESETRVLESSRPVVVDLDYEAERDVDPVAVNFTVFRTDGLRCLDAPTDGAKIRAIPKGKGTLRLRLPNLGLTTGAYQASISVTDPATGETFVYHDQLHPFAVRDRREGQAVIWVDYDWELRRQADDRKARRVKAVKEA